MVSMKGSTYERHAYVKSIRNLEKAVKHLEAVSLAEEEALRDSRLREQVLETMVAHTGVLQKLLLEYYASQEKGHADAPVIPEAAPINASYSVRLLHSIKWKHVDKALHMNVDDWVDRLTWLFTRYTLLLELMSHTSQQPAGAAEPAQPGQMGASAASDAELLDETVFDKLRMSVVALMFNPLPIYSASALNLVTRQPGSAPPGWFERVVQRVAYTDEQLKLCSIAMEQFERMNQGAWAQRAQLAQEATEAGVSIISQAQQQEQGHKQQQEQQQHRDATPGSDADAPPPLAQKLARHFHGIPLPPLLVLLSGAECLSPKQMATMNVAAYPYVAVPGDLVKLAIKQRAGLSSAEATAAAAASDSSNRAQVSLAAAAVPAHQAHLHLLLPRPGGNCSS